MEQQAKLSEKITKQSQKRDRGPKVKNESDYRPVILGEYL